MVPALLHLIDVQRIDVKIDALDKQRAQYPKRLAELTTKLDATNKTTDQMSGVVGEKEKERRALEGTLSLDQNKLKKWEARLAEIRNQREYLALSREVEGQRKQNNETQEKILNLSIELEGLSGQLEGAKDGLAEQEIDLQTERSEVQKKIAEFDALIAEQKKERDEYIGQVPPPLLKRYDQIRQKRMGIALAAVEAGRCTACNIGLPPQLYNILQRGETVEACPSCHRIIYYREPAKAAGEEPQANVQH